MEYIDYLEKIKGFSPRTIRIYVKYAYELERCSLDYQAFLVNATTTSANTRRLMASAIISYYKFRKDERWKEIGLPKKEIKFKEFIEFDEYKTLLNVINSRTKMGLQKRVVVRLLFETGIRSEELLSIRIDDIVDNQIRIYGKGKRERIVKMSEWLTDELMQYCKGKNGRIFTFQYKNLHAKIASLNKEKHITPHMFRRGYAKYCFEKGVSLYDISLSMGHSSIETTAGYIKRSSEDVEIFRIF